MHNNAGVSISSQIGVKHIIGMANKTRCVYDSPLSPEPMPNIQILHTNILKTLMLVTERSCLQIKAVHIW